MRILEWAKDGGPSSPVDGFFFIEWKGLFSIALLKFNEGGRETFHSHAFDAATWFIKGDMVEELENGFSVPYRRSWFPKITKRDRLHKVRANKTSWCLTIRGPWCKYWWEYDDKTSTSTLLSSGRQEVLKAKGLPDAKKEEEQSQAT